MSSEEMKPFWVEVKAEHENGSSGSGRGRGRRNNGKGPKKQPQRGLGVEQLERMRMEETLKKAAEASGIPTFHDHQHQHLLQCCYPPPQVFASGNVPVRYGAPTSNGFQFPQQQNNNNNNNNNIASGSSGGLIGFNAWVVPNQQHNNNRVTNFPYGSAPFLSTTTPPLVEISKDLSSMPNLHSNHPTFDLFLKKTRLNEDLRRDRPMEVWSNHVHNFFGFMPQNAVTPNLDECAEVVAVHRRGGKSGSRTRVFMEYEFFPRKDDIGTTSKEQEFPTIGSVVEQLGCSNEPSSSLTLTTYAAADTPTHSHSLDLSLKL